MSSPYRTQFGRATKGQIVTHALQNGSIGALRIGVDLSGFEQGEELPDITDESFALHAFEGVPVGVLISRQFEFDNLFILVL